MGEAPGLGYDSPAFGSNTKKTIENGESLALLFRNSY